MNPAPSVILFTVLSGFGFGFLFFLATGAIQPAGWAALALWGLGYGFALAGLVASTFHLGHPERALLAFSQWRTSWLSREAWAAVVTLVLLLPMALSDWLGLGLPRVIGAAGALMCGLTVLCTAMIYAQIRAVPRWSHPVTPALFLTFALTGGAILALPGMIAAFLCLALAGLLILAFRLGDRQFAQRGATMGAATGLGALGKIAVFELPHTGDNYLMREMIHVVARKHAQRLRRIAVACAGLAPAAALMLLPAALAIPLAVGLHLTGAFAARWLFFAEAEHVVGLYYGQRSAV